ncbi:MAG: hypothetical protein AW08_03059 [Candidatus Accumulibacter adjunctus]|uniref:Uncharacterized protein n=1 Tax=Candidatus Accumulibacter adjunctus TaxID=1454001 RepID=A0A011PH22_9PROT|nr:MAG: hypothetical protein AW08_03059 [Candidatus Accumulibacter adjunctus]
MQTALRLEVAAEVVVPFGKIRLQRQGPLVRTLGIPQAVELHQGIAEVAMGQREVGTQFRCPPVADHRIFVSPLRQEGIAEVVVGFGEVVPGSDCAPLAAFGFRQFTKIGKNQPEVAEDLCVLWQQSGRAPHHRQCLRIAALRLQQGAEDFPAETSLRMLLRQAACGHFSRGIFAALVEIDRRSDGWGSRPIQRLRSVRALRGSARSARSAGRARCALPLAAGDRSGRQLQSKLLDFAAVQSMLLSERKDRACLGYPPAAAQRVDVTQPVLARLRVCCQRSDQVWQRRRWLRTFDQQRAESMVGGCMVRSCLQDGTIEFFGFTHPFRLLTLTRLRQRLRQRLVEADGRRRCASQFSWQVVHPRQPPSARRRKPR